MKSFITKSGEIAYVPTDDELEIIQTALKQFNQLLLLEKGEVING